MMSNPLDYEYEENFSGEKTDAPQNPMYRVTHFAQVGSTPFVVYLRDLAEAVRLSDALSMYDAFQFNHHFKGDYTNPSIIGEFDEDDQEWYDLDAYDLANRLEA